ncbi:MAG: ATP-binding cassette domain-containing protein [Armatimonadetes bacterium]|nr:ATP-binding cassette domain-containing protein [Armatimonadota bacterium]
MAEIASSALIRFEDVGKSYDGGQSFAVRHVSFQIAKGETLVLLGSSGSGKSTLLKMINGLIAPSHGAVTVRDRSGQQLQSVQMRRSIGYVSQGIALFPFMRVWENVALPLRLAGLPIEERKRKATEALRLVELPEGVEDRLPSELSGGQQQRVGVARALVTGTDILLMDEPFGALDAITRESLQAEVARLKEKLGVTIVFVTHDLFEALALADRIVVMHEGNMEQIGTADEMLHQPATDFVRELFEKPAKLLKVGGRA